MTWTHEDGGPMRQQLAPGQLGLAGGGGHLVVVTRAAPATTMVVGDDEGLFLLRHTAGPDAVATVEQLDPVTLEPVATSPELPAGPVWPGGMGLQADGTMVVVFGRYAHRLDRGLAVLASTELPRDRPYNSFITLPDGHLVTKDFGGSLPGERRAPSDRVPAELVVLEPERLQIVDRCEVGEASIARLSAAGDDVYVVGDTSLLRARWDGGHLAVDEGFVARYRWSDDQGFGWDCVLTGDAAWFLDNGDGTERFAGTLRGLGLARDPLHLIRVDLANAGVTSVEICGRPGGVVANPPVVDERRGVVVGYDSGNGVIAGFDLTDLSVLWRRDQDHASHLVLYEGSGELVTGDHDHVVVLDVATGTELGRADSGLGMQSVLFPAPGGDGVVYVTSFLGVARFEVAPTGPGAATPQGPRRSM